MLTVHASNFRALRRFRWSLEPGVSLLTGANGSGKTTVLDVLRTLRAAYERGLPDAVSTILGGSHNLRNRSAGPEESVELGVDVDELQWRLRLTPRGTSVDHVTEERLTRGDEVLFARDSLGNFHYRGVRQELGATASEALGLEWVSETHGGDRDVMRVAAVVSSFQAFRDADIARLRESGSKANEYRRLRVTSANVLTMLRTWKNRRRDEERFAFVDQGLRSAFPGVYAGLDLEGAQTIAGAVYRAGDETPTPLRDEANGMVSMMMTLAQVASAEPGSVVCSDEPENGMHPFAIRRLVHFVRERAAQQQLKVAFTTHSPVLLNAFQGEPGRVFVLERDREVLPVRLDELRDPHWLSNYILGELYENGEFAANQAAVREP